MDLTVKRLYADRPGVAIYHLYDADGRLRLVADHGTPWLTDDLVRFSRPSGRPIAALNPTRVLVGSHAKPARSFVIVVNFAAFAIINEYENVSRFFSVEVGDETWLANSDERHIRFYNNVAVSAVADPSEMDLGGPVGQIRIISKTETTISLSENWLARPRLTALALLFLHHYSG